MRSAITRWPARAGAALRRPKSWALLLAALVVVLPALFFSLRNVVLLRMVERRIGALRGRAAGLQLNVGGASFRGLSRVVVTGIRLQSADRELTVKLGAGVADLSFWRMVIGQVRLERLELDDLDVVVARVQAPAPAAAPPAAGRRPLRSPASARPPVAVRAPGRAPGYGEKAARLLRLFFDRVPDSLTVNQLTVRTDIDGIRQAFRVARIELQGPHVETRVGIESESGRREFLVSGDIDRSRRQISFRVAPGPGGARGPLPFIDRQWELRVGFDAIAFRLKSGDLRNGVLPLDGSLALSNLTVNQPSIATADVCVPGVAVDFTVRMGPGYAELCAPTRVRVQQLAFRPSGRLQTWPTRRLELRLAPVRFRAQDFFAALPAGLFRNLEGFIARGEIGAALDFAVDLDLPEALRLDGFLDKGTFRIVRFGRTDFRAVNAPFVYTAYERDRAVRSFAVGPENPDFRPLERISPFLRDALLISEDGAFFSHRGFLIDPLKESIARDLRERRFARGASTISMQLVKNLYLKRYKTVARKLEEMIITWLIEENRLIPKERMYEIYLNVIEWGPDVYGAREAARFYFAKEASDLTLAEAIFMASIVPRPKKFIYSFDERQQLRPWLGAYFNLISAKMLGRGMIDQAEYDRLLPDVRLRGPARLLLKGQEPPPEEALELPDETDE